MHVEFGEDYIRIYKGNEEIVGWHEQEWLDDPASVTPAIANAIHLAHTDPAQLEILLNEVK